MENVCQIIKKYNNHVSRKKPKLTPSCNCRMRDDCSMNGNSLLNNVIYKCTISPTTTTEQRAYLGLAEGEWKQRYYNHTRSFKNARHKNDTTLSQNWTTIYQNWKKKSILKIVPGHSNISKWSFLCLHEKLYIATYHDQEKLLNKRSKLISKCRHENQFLLTNYKAND